MTPEQEPPADADKLLSRRDQTTAPLDPTPPAAAVSPKMEGRRIGPYEIVRELGQGGMGTVYLAVRADDVFRKRVAIKLIRSGAASPEVLRRFRRERQILAALDHPNIARILDGGSTEEGLPYLVMEYVDGKPIHAWCDQRNLNVSDRLQLFRSVCEAVEYAQSKGVVHRDLKPGNILVTQAGTVKLLDFGIAKLLQTDYEETLSMTQTGILLMTPEYASPEQVRGEGISPATDVYSLGVILFELLTGRRPYQLKNRRFYEILRAICDEEPMRLSAAVTRQDGEGILAQGTCEGTAEQLRSRYLSEWPKSQAPQSP